MPQIETLRGPVDTSALGFTLMHEHIFVLSDGVNHQFPQIWEDAARIAEAREKLRAMTDAGVQTFVDLTVHGTGRDVRLMQRVAGELPLNVVVATGLYTYDAVPRHFVSRNADYMADLFVSDIQNGIQGTNVKAGILKCATDEPGVTQGVEKVLRAVARAHRRTGVPISTHTHPATKRGLEQQKIFLEEGVDLSRVVIGHSGDSEDLAYLEALMKAGSYIGMDRFGIDMYLATEKRVAVIAGLSKLGYAGQMVLGHDASCYMDWFPAEALAQAAPRWHFRHISDDVLPMLRDAGVPKEQIDLMTTGNPHAIFEKQGAY
jgi:phosphotriesterase-related protein